MANTSKKLELRLKRKKRVRKKISGTAERPRLSVSRSARHIAAQLIDDTTGTTLAAISSFSKDNRQPRANKEVCHALGKKLAEVAKAKNIASIVFDKNGFAYHGRVQAMAEGAREGGLTF